MKDETESTISMKQSTKQNAEQSIRQNAEQSTRQNAEQSTRQNAEQSTRQNAEQSTKQNTKQKIEHEDKEFASYRDKYKNNLMACLNSSDLSVKMFVSTGFNMQMLYEFVDFYEKKYPERKQAFLRFFRKTDRSFFLHIVKIKAMSYMLNEEFIGKMTVLMKKRNGIYIRLFASANPAPHGASAYFGRDFWGRPRIMYYDILSKSQLHPPYKTFFHEFGHALDFLMVRGKGFFSDHFSCTRQAEYKEIHYDDFTHQISIQKKKSSYTKTIHEWAEFDVENFIIQIAAELLQAEISASSRRSYLNPAIPWLKKFKIIDFVVHRLFFKPDGCEQLESLTGRPYFDEIRDLYYDVAEVMNKKIFVNYKNIIVLPRDIFGGITNNQLGGGHSSDYWFRGNRRINKVSREAFAGYFEYKAILADPVFQAHLINPYQCMPNTEAALEAMLKAVLKE